MDNSVALSARSAQELQQCGELSGDPLELVQIRREDFEFHKGKMEGDDVVQSGAKGASMRRGCQRPGAFLIMASGLDNVRFHLLKLKKHFFSFHSIFLSLPK